MVMPLPIKGGVCVCGGGGIVWVALPTFETEWPATSWRPIATSAMIVISDVCTQRQDRLKSGRYWTLCVPTLPGQPIVWLRVCTQTSFVPPYTHMWLSTADSYTMAPRRHRKLRLYQSWRLRKPVSSWGRCTQTQDFRCYEDSVCTGSGWVRAVWTGSGWTRAVCTSSGWARAVCTSSGWTRTVCASSEYTRAGCTSSGWVRAFWTGSWWARVVCDTNWVNDHYEANWCHRRPN